MTTASALKDALITNLSAASVFGAGQVAITYDVMESTSGCCCIVNWQELQSESMTFGNNRREIWTFLLEAKVKDLGDPFQLTANTFAVIDKIVATFKTDDRLQGEAQGIGRLAANRVPGEAETIGGATWLPVDVLVEVLTWD